MGRYRANYERRFGKDTEEIQYLTVKSCYYCQREPTRYFHIWNRIGRYVIAGCSKCAPSFEKEMTAYKFEEISEGDVISWQIIGA